MWIGGLQLLYLYSYNLVLICFQSVLHELELYEDFNLEDIRTGEDIDLC